MPLPRTLPTLTSTKKAIWCNLLSIQMQPRSQGLSSYCRETLGTRLIQMKQLSKKFRCWFSLCAGNSPRSTYQYSNMAPRLSGQNCKLFQFLLSLNSQNTQKITPNIEVCPERLGAMSEYWYIERGLLTSDSVVRSDLILQINANFFKVLDSAIRPHAQ